MSDELIQVAIRVEVFIFRQSRGESQSPKLEYPHAGPAIGRERGKMGRTSTIVDPSGMRIVYNPMRGRNSTELEFENKVEMSARVAGNMGCATTILPLGAQVGRVLEERRGITTYVGQPFGMLT